MYEKLRKEWEEAYANTPIDKSPPDFEHWLVAKIAAYEAEEPPQAVLLSVSASDLADHFSEDDLQYITQKMLNEICDALWQTDDDSWHGMYVANLDSVIGDSWGYWQDMIDTAKKNK